jgi:PAS domain S-box-containing protein
MSRQLESFGRIPSPWRMFLTVLAIVFVAEGVVMLFMPWLLGGISHIAHPTLYEFAAPLVDDVLLILSSAPFLWFFVVRPLRGVALQEHVRAVTVVAHARDGIVTINDKGVVESFNPAAERIFGYTAAELLGRPLVLLIPERHREAHQLALANISKAGESSDSERSLETYGLRKDGTEFPMELSVATWKVREGTYHTAVLRDITARKQAEEALRTHTNRLEAVRAVATEITRELELSRLLNLITRRAAELFRATSGSVLLWDEQAQQLIPQSWYGFGDWFKSIRLQLGEGFAGTIAQRGQGLIVHHCSASPDAFAEFSQNLGMGALVGQPLMYHDRLLGVIIVGNVGTERVFTDQDLEMLGLFADQAAIAIENARLYGEIQSLAVAQERQRLAREMHDSVAQSLSLLHLQIAKMQEGQAAADSRLTASLRDMTKITENAYDELRQSIYGLRTMVSRGLGWVATLDEYLHEFTTRTGIKVTLETADGLPAELPPVTEVQLVRIVQEALANVRKHAGTDHARVQLQPTERSVRVTIEDDGCGLQPEASTAIKQRHFGLEIMRERAESLGGQLAIESTPGHGTRIVATLPCAA